MNVLSRFLAANKVWWITPIVLVAALVVVMLLLEGRAGTAANSPFQYDAF